MSRCLGDVLMPVTYGLRNGFEVFDSGLQRDGALRPNQLYAGIEVFYDFGTHFLRPLRKESLRIIDVAD